ncbi:MAG: UDP-N-acetylmuramoyl-L-alanine--D-glutamate ligase [Dehalococcoidia bacterium]|nr:UDP-N-acetylmuramoyl-L-alanine--D-glutamate ligase [Dehalococcoidia bacterium]
MGLGVHGGGVGVARFLAEHGAQVTVTDLRPAEQLAASLDDLADLPITYVLGKHREADFRSAHLIVRNPAVPLNSPYLQAASAAGVPIVMEMTLFFQECPSPRIIGVTGTKGKTTTTLLLGALLEAHGLPHVVAGNLRRSALETLPRVTKESWVVLELSSWQLEGLIPLQRSPHLAVITNIMPDHLDRYPSYDEYARSKGLIVRWQRPDDCAVLNKANPPVRALSRDTAGRIVWFDPTSDSPGWEAAHLYGAHNRANVAAASTAARVIGIPAGTIGRAVAAFPGVPHRLETVREFEGVRYINDTTATTPEAMLAALGAVDRPTVLIAGGTDKGLDFSSLRATVQGPRSTVTSVVLLKGTATAKIAAACGPKVLGQPGDLEAALGAASGAAEPGGVVLLSPGCASFGMFANEFDRGDRFRDLVRALT